MCRLARCAVAFAVVLTLVGDPTAAEARPCPVFTAARVQGTVSEPQLTELSGLAASQANPGVLWAHSDSPSGTEVFALSLTGERLATVELQGATAVDWEDIAVGPGPEPGQSYLYVGDIGDNQAERTHVTVYRVPEPVLDDPPLPDPVVLADVDAFTLDYPDGAHDAEALLVDPRSGDLFIVTKTLSSGPSGIYRLATPGVPADPLTLTAVGSLSLPSAPFAGSTVTGGDISPSGDEILLRTYFTAFAWRRGPAQSVAGAFSGTRCPVPIALETQGEAIAYRRNGNAYLTTSEWRDQGPRPLHEYRARRRPDGLIRRGTGAFAGDGIVNLTGAGQTRTATVNAGRTVTFTVRVDNDGDRVDDIGVRGDGGSPQLTVRYRRNGVDITAQVVAGTYRVQDLASGGRVEITVVVTARSGAPRGSSHTVAVTLTSQASTSARDRVKATTTVG